MNNQEKSLEQHKKFFNAICENEEDALPEDLSCLNSVSAEDLVRLNNAGIAPTRLPIKEQAELDPQEVPEIYYFMPIIDDWADEPFLPYHPITILHNQQQKMVPYMTGVNKNEGAMNVAPLWKEMDPNDNQLAKHWGMIGAQTVLWKQRKETTFDD